MYSVCVEKVASVMGGALVLGSVPHTAAELAGAIACGLPRQVAVEVATNATLDATLRERVRNRVVAPAAFRSSPRLSLAAGERAERIARMIALATDAFGGPDPARSWLTEPHVGLLGRMPLEIATTNTGARKVEQLLLTIRYGVPA